MGWFSFSTKKAERPSSEPKPQQLSSKIYYPSGKLKTKNEIWLETASEEVFQKTLRNMAEEVKQTRNFRPKSNDANNASAFAGAFLTKISKIDRSRLIESQKRTLAEIIFDRYPHEVAIMETALIDLNGDRDFAVEVFGERLCQYLARYIDPLPRKLPIPKVPSMDAESEHKAVITVGTAESDVKLTALKTLASQAYNAAVTTEDKFFAEQASNSYIPESVRLLTGLVNAPDDMKAEANEMFLRQLDIIEQHLNAIVRRTATTSLSDMKAHMEFLESKNGQLTLDK